VKDTERKVASSGKGSRDGRSGSRSFCNKGTKPALAAQARLHLRRGLAILDEVRRPCSARCGIEAVRAAASENYL